MVEADTSGNAFLRFLRRWPPTPWPAAAMLAVLLPLLVVLVQSEQDDYGELTATTPGRVVDGETTTETSGNTRRTVCRGTVVFSVAGSEHRFRGRALDACPADGSEPAVDVYYEPADPEHANTSGAQQVAFGVMSWFLLLLWPFALVLLVHSLWHRRDRRRHEPAA